MRRGAAAPPHSTSSVCSSRASPPQLRRVDNVSPTRSLSFFLSRQPYQIPLCAVSGLSQPNASVSLPAFTPTAEGAEVLLRATLRTHLKDPAPCGHDTRLVRENGIDASTWVDGLGGLHIPPIMFLSLSLSLSLLLSQRLSASRQSSVLDSSLTV